MTIADRNGLPLAVITESASPHEVKLVEQTIEKRFIDAVPEKLKATLHTTVIRSTNK